MKSVCVDGAAVHLARLSFLPQILTHVRRLTDIGESFLGRKESELMARAVRDRAVSYVKGFHERALHEMCSRFSKEDWAAASVDKVGDEVYLRRAQENNCSLPPLLTGF